MPARSSATAVGTAPATAAAPAPATTAATTDTPQPAPATAGGSADDGVVPGPSSAATTVATGDRPVRITIPSIGVNSPLVDLGLQKDGTIEVPADYQRAGWLDRSAAPGRQGPAVIAGHIDSKSGPAVFYRLADLSEGAKISVLLANGTTVSFTVDGVQRYAKTKFPTAAVYGPVPGPVLRLITCGGQFDARSGHYLDNTVVYAS